MLIFTLESSTPYEIYPEIALKINDLFTLLVLGYSKEHVYGHLCSGQKQRMDGSMV